MDQILCLNFEGERDSKGEEKGWEEEEKRVEGRGEGVGGKGEGGGRERRWGWETVLRSP